jgi:surfeit locus 1 family protein
VLGQVKVTGNLNWPDDVDRFTPAPDGDVWYARDVAAMAEKLGTEPVLVVARSDTGQGVEALPVTTSGIPNNHRNYAITWFSLAAIWAGMTLFALQRIRRGTS